MLRIQLLGPVEAFVDDAALPLGGPKQRTVLAVLAADPGKRVSVDRLTEAVWGDDVPDRASRSLSTYVSNLRGVLGDVLIRDGNGYALVADRSQVDATDFADRVAVAHRENDPALAAKGLRSALDLWADSPFGDIDGNHVLGAEVRRLAELRVSAMESAVEAELGSDDELDLVELDRLILEHPHREKIRGLHMRALYSAGRQAEALTSYKAFRDQLATDLGIDPSPELQQLELQILQQDPELSPRQPSPTSRDAESLPVRYSTFVGRSGEIAAVSAAIATDRLVTVVGPGGIGKSSLVVEAARSPEVHRGEIVVRVVIDILGDGEVVPALVRALGLDPAPGVDPVDVVAAYTATRPHLLILDGCEAHISVVVDLVDRVLSSSPQVRVLAASRESLGLAGEVLIRIGGLDERAAVELFVDRARLGSDMGDLSVEKTRDLCVALDGMPLAIELAAARARLVPLDRLVERLDDMIPLLRKSRTSGGRHDSIAAAMVWSYDLLDGREQRALRWLSVFATGFTRRDVEALLDDQYAEDIVARLIDVSLVQPADDSGLHRMLEPVRQYAEHLMTESGEDNDAGQHHARWVADELTRVAGDLWSVRFREAVAWVLERDREIDRAAEWATRHSQPGLVVDILAAHGNRMFGVSLDSAVLVEAALAATGHPSVERSGHLAVAMVRAAAMLVDRARVDEAVVLLERAEGIARDCADNVALGDVLLLRATVQNLVGSSAPELVDLVDEAIGYYEDAGSTNAKVYLVRRAIIVAGMGRFEEAVSDLIAYEEWATSVRGRPEWNTIGWKGRLARLTGDRRSAIRFDRDLTEVAHANLDYWMERNMWESIAVDAAFLGDEALMAEAMSHLDAIHQRTGILISAFAKARVASAQGRHHDVLTIAARWIRDLTAHVSGSEADRAALVGMEVAGNATRVPNFFETLLPVALAFEATGRTDEAQRVAREAPNLMAQSNFNHWDELGETGQWAELLTRLGGGEPDGLSLDQGFTMVHDILVDDKRA